MSSRRSPVGRPEATSHAAIESAAFELFADRGFDATTLTAIADAVGVSKRTLFRYYPSKNDIPWGQFDRSLDGFRELLASMPEELPVYEAVHRGVVAFNDFPDDAQPPHRDRMRLILKTPTLQAHSVLRYGDWRGVIEDYVVKWLTLLPEDPLPRIVGQVSLAMALSSYDQWLATPGSSITAILDAALPALRTYLDADQG